MCRWCCWGRRRRTGCPSSGCAALPPSRLSCSPCWCCWECASRASNAGGLEVRGAVELAFVEALEGLALRERHAPVADGTLAVARQRRIQLRDVVLHVFEHLVGCVALDDLFAPPAALVV